MTNDTRTPIEVLVQAAQDKAALLKKASQIETHIVIPEVIEARLSGSSWQAIATALGIDKDTAVYRYQATTREHGDVPRIPRCKLPTGDGGYCRKAAGVTMRRGEQSRAACVDHALALAEQGWKRVDV